MAQTVTSNMSYIILHFNFSFPSTVWLARKKTSQSSCKMKGPQISWNWADFFFKEYLSFSSTRHPESSLSQHPIEGLFKSFQHREIKCLVCRRQESVIFFSLLFMAQSLANRPRIQSFVHLGTGFIIFIVLLFQHRYQMIKFGKYI